MNFPVTVSVHNNKGIEGRDTCLAHAKRSGKGYDEVQGIGSDIGCAQSCIGAQALARHGQMIEDIIKKSSYRTVTTTDQKLSINIPVDWVEITKENLLKYLT